LFTCVVEPWVDDALAHPLSERRRTPAAKEAATAAM
jgi:hypothetical protein